MVMLLNVIVILIGVSSVVTYEWIKEGLHQLHFALGLGVAGAAGYAAAQRSYDHQLTLWSAYKRCQVQASVFPGLANTCHHRYFPAAPINVPQPLTLGEVLLDGLKAIPWIFLGIVIGFAIRLAWNSVFPQYQIEDHTEST
jgi:hypothetical protein